VLITEESSRLNPGLQIGAGGTKIGEGRVAFDKLQMHQPAGRIVDEDKQWAAVLEPLMLAAVNLHQFADAVAATAWLVDALSPLLAIEPQPGHDHP
jgi:hypothetical protein